MATKTKKQTKLKNNLKLVHSQDKPTTTYRSGKVVRIPVNEIDYSPFNDRQYSEAELQLFAKDISRNDVQVPIMVRPMNGRFELVYGERRTRASNIAGLKDVPAIIRKGLSDEETMFIQVLENFDREDLHPMDIARSFNRLKEKGFTVKDIAARLARHKSFVISRLKLILLNGEWQHIFRLNKVTTFQAFEVASLSQESQTELFQALCKNWKDKNFKLNNLEYYISRFKYDLKRAPFDIKDKNLVPEAGACTGCPFNSATFRTLFPDYSKDGSCSKKECFQSKCTKHLIKQTEQALKEEKPEALIFVSTPSEQLLNIIQQVDGTTELPQFDFNSITILEEPEEPNKDDYMQDYSDEQPEFDEEGYKQAVEEYTEESEEYNKQKEQAQKGVIVNEGASRAVWFLPERKSDTSDASKGTVKEIQTALKSGTATTALLDAGIERIQASIRQIEAGVRQNIQDEIHTQFNKKVEEEGVLCIPTEADRAIMRFMIYQSLDYQARGKVDQVLFSELSEDDEVGEETLYDSFFNMNGETESFLVRALSLSKAESKYSSSKLAIFLNKTAESAGININEIETREQEKGNERKEKKNQKILDLQKAIEKLKNKEESTKTAA